MEFKKVVVGTTMSTLTACAHLAPVRFVLYSSAKIEGLVFGIENLVCERVF
jgi:hypothetical protein